MKTILLSSVYAASSRVIMFVIVWRRSYLLFRHIAVTQYIIIFNNYIILFDELSAEYNKSSDPSLVLDLSLIWQLPVSVGC